MKLRTVLLILSFLALLTTFCGGYLYFSFLETSAFKEANRQASLNAEAIRSHLSSFLSENIKAVRVLAGMQELKSALLKPTDKNAIDQADRILDHFQRTLEADVCYLMDLDGNTIASSNRNRSDSFVGENYGFRPYFLQAAEGNTYVYMARGVTSNRRGIYYSNPVRVSEQSSPYGVVIIKASVDEMEKEFRQSYDGIVALADPHGVIFMSNRRKWLYKLLWKPTEDVISQIAETRQFGNGPWTWTGMTRKGVNSVVDQSGNNYLLYLKSLPHYPGWNVVFLRKFSSISRKVTAPIIRTAVPVILGISSFIGFFVFFLYRRASHDLRRRQRAERALQESEETARALLNASGDRAFLLDREGTILSLNGTAAEAFGKPREDLLGKVVFDLFPEDLATRRSAFHEQVVATGKPVQYEDEREGKYLDTHAYPIADTRGEVARVALFSRDITERKCAEEELKRAREELKQYSLELELQVKKRTEEIRRLSGRIMENQENERAAIARELHDELGQILTALRMDAVWLGNHLAGKNPVAEERALTMRTLIDKTIDDVRGLAIRLRPGVLDDLGLVEAVEWYTDEFEKRTGVTCVFTVSSSLPPFPDYLSTAAYRIMQEALTNVARHSFASKVEVRLAAERGFLVLTIQDDGRGFDVRGPTALEGLGLAGMKERAELLYGTLEIRSTPGKGSLLRFRAPFQEQKENGM
jgi:PAS domain S-box-containing protein